MRYARLLLAAAASLAVSSPAVAQMGAEMGDPTRGQELSQACVACHGADGNSTNPEWPKIAGQHASYIYKQLQDYKSERRVNALMAGQVANLSDQDMRDLAAFYAGQTMTTGVADEAVVTRGEQIYRGGIPAQGVAACIACHGANGRGNPAAMFPKVAGQHARYNNDQLGYFRSGQRANDNGRMMRNVAARMSDSDIEAVSEYMAGLRGE
ncbi:MAG: c-type cytochrome [Thioalkalivibrionaceae bacterium]